MKVILVDKMPKPPYLKLLLNMLIWQIILPLILVLPLLLFILRIEGRL